jgi:AcrR family transcriptional regulator
MRKTARPKPETTSSRLLAAAEREFNSLGYEGTDTNRIARRAGFAPQTFYRHFADKKAIFLAVYARWWQAEVAAFEALLAQNRHPIAPAAARVALKFHGRWRRFRRSLRHLAVDDPEVRAARADSRKAQLLRLQTMSTRQGEAANRLAAALLTVERLCDAVAENELNDLGIGRREQEKLVAESLEALFSAAGLSAEPDSGARKRPLSAAKATRNGGGEPFRPQRRSQRPKN